MCNKCCIKFGQDNISEKDIIGKKVIEIGCVDINGSLRSYVESFKPQQYIGTDIVSNKGVDKICYAEKLFDVFKKESFNILICTEVLEHVENWKAVISNFKNIISVNGFLLITTRSKGFKFHGYPHDYWRYEEEDFKYIFSDMIINKIEKDTRSPGIFIKATKPENFIEKNLSEYKLYSMIKKDRS